MPIVQIKRELDKEAKEWWAAQTQHMRNHWITKLKECAATDDPERWRRYVIQKASNYQRPTFLAAYLWNRHVTSNQMYDIDALLNNPRGWTGFSQDFNTKGCRIKPLEPLGEPLGESVAAQPSQLNPTTSQKENTMNQFNQTPVAKPTLIFGRVTTDMTEQDFFDALEKLEKRKETLEIARGSGSSEYVNEQIQQVNDDIAAVIKTMDKVLG